MKKDKRKKASKKAKPRASVLKHFLVNKLRRISYQWPERKTAIKAARVERGKYKCNSCEGIFGPKEINADHIEPVIDPHVGFVDWNTYIDRLFCSSDLIQIICKPCHEAKTFLEQMIRQDVKEENKPEEEQDDI